MLLLLSLLSPVSCFAGFRLVHDLKTDASLSSDATAFRELNAPDRILALDPSGRFVRFSLSESKALETGSLAL
ncbi:hypothetical protein EB061_07925, partial [bacterium]|nr:hypothetical protein [bacterium]